MKFFHRFGSINYRFFALADNILLKCEKKKKYTRAISYLDKYSYVLDDIKYAEVSDEYPDKIWQCWFQGQENMPEIVKICTNSVKKYHGEDVIFLDDSNISKYLDLPDYIIEKHKKGIIPNANFSDIVRLSLIAKYGGCWVDSTVFLTGKIPDEILKADFFTFKSSRDFVLKYVKNLDDFRLYCNNLNSVLSLESPYFIRAKAGNGIINGVLNLFFEYWKHENKLRDYLMIDKYFAIALVHNEEFREQFLNMPQYNIENVLMLQHALFEHYDEKMYNQITSFGTIHKLTHKNLKIDPYKDSFLQHILNNN